MLRQPATEDIDVQGGIEMKAEAAPQTLLLPTISPEQVHPARLHCFSNPLVSSMSDKVLHPAHKTSQLMCCHGPTGTLERHWAAPAQGAGSYVHTAVTHALAGALCTRNI